MLKISLAAICLFISFNAFSFDCTAIDRFVENGEYHESKAAFKTTLDSSTTLKMEVEFNGQLYSITYNKEDDDGLLQIINATDDTKGIVARSSFNRYGKMSLTSVDGQTVHRMECFK